MDASREVAVVTPWYPTSNAPFVGSFVQTMVAATAPGCDRLTVYHCDVWQARMSRRRNDPMVRATERLLRQADHDVPTVGGARLVYTPVPVPSGLSFPELAVRHERALRSVLDGRAVPADVVHAHVGIYSGWAALRNLRPGARLFVTEHASFLAEVLGTPEGRAIYDALLRRCTAFFAVGEPIRAALVDALPQHAGRIELIPNAIEFATERGRPVTDLTRWLYVGSLTPRKRVDLLVRAFARCHGVDPGLSLTIAGDGGMAGGLRELAESLGIAGAVDFAGAVAPETAQRLMRDHDLLVHPSRHESFGMTIVEAVAAGMPVLVTRCGGPEEVLAGIEAAAGELVDVEDEPDSLVDGYWRLRKNVPHGLDLPLARRTLVERHGYRAVAGAHHRVWFGPEA